MEEREFEASIQNTLRKLTREQLEEIALRMARHLNRERQLALINGYALEDIEVGVS
jgi:hypothetical protein